MSISPFIALSFLSEAIQPPPLLTRTADFAARWSDALQSEPRSRGHQASISRTIVSLRDASVLHGEWVPEHG